jgi:hypothetical protein
VRPVRLGKGYQVRAGKVVAKHVPRDAAAARREKPGGSKRVRVGRVSPLLQRLASERQPCACEGGYDWCERCDPS